LHVDSDEANIAKARFLSFAGKGRNLKIASPKLQTSHLTANEEALSRCETALGQKDKGDFEGAQETMRPLWRRVGERPDIDGLHAPVAAEVLLCAGILTGWIGSKTQNNESQELAKNLISESISYFELAGDQKKIAAARTEIAYCYWREGELDEARIMLRAALQKLTTAGTTRARALLKLTTVEFSSSRHHEALRILIDNESLFEKINDLTTRGVYHGQLAIALRNIARSEQRADYYQRAVAAFQKADECFRLARNPVFRADVKNNAGLLLSNLARFAEAHRSLDEARRLSVSLKDKARTAQFDESRAQVFLAQGKAEQAEAIARRAALALEKSGQKILLVDALITQGIASARSGKQARAQFILQRAYEVATQVGALDKAGLATLTLIEEVEHLSPNTMQAAYDRAHEWLSRSGTKEILFRLNEAAGKLASSVRGELSAEKATEILLRKSGCLQERVLDVEREMIKQALAQANGSITHAASSLGLSYQALSYIITARHKDLLRERSPVHRRRPRTPREAKTT
jgi:tetratricopeptide (TPR) repeat protein